MNRDVLFSKVSDEWSTPQATFDALNAEFGFDLDCAATRGNQKCPRWLGPGGVSPNALVVSWGQETTCWLNPPYSRVRAFMAKTAEEVRRGCTVVVLVPSRTDTRWWHDHVWDHRRHTLRSGVAVRFLPGRLKFGGATNGAPFPSVVLIFRPSPSHEDLHGELLLSDTPKQ